LGFCLQRFVHILSRTPFGSPCPAFPWPRGRLFSLASRTFAFRLRLFDLPSFDFPSLVLVCRWLARSRERPFHRTVLADRESARFVPPVSGCPAPAVSAARLHSNHAFACRNSRNQAQDMRAFSGRVLRACRARTSLGCSALQGLTVQPWTGFRQSLPSRSCHHRAGLAETSGFRSVFTADSEVCVAASLPLPRPRGLFTLLPWPAASEFAPAGLSFHLRARSALPPRRPPVFAGSAFLRRAFLPERIRSRLSGHW